MWIEPVTLTGRTVRLEPLDARHAPALFAAADPELFRHTPQAPAAWSVAGFERQIAKVNATPDVVAFAIVLLATDAAIGRTTFMEIREHDRTVEIGRTWIARVHHGTAVNPEAKLLMLGHAFEALPGGGAVRVQLTTGASNLHSQRAIAKLGAVREGVLRSHRMLPDGTPRDTVVFSVIASEWPVVKRGLETRVG